MINRRTLCLLAALLAAGCWDSTRPPAALEGDWTHFSPGFNYNMTLMTDANTITGVGQWRGEACCEGKVEVHGTGDASTVELDLDFVATQGALQLPAPFSQHFTGHLVGSDSLTGFLTTNDQVIPFGYRRTGPAVAID
jgi:hypothetical protein